MEEKEREENNSRIKEIFSGIELGKFRLEVLCRMPKEQLGILVIYLF